MLKRWFDLTIAGTLLVVLSPILILISVGIGLLDGSPILFRQTRLGKGGRSFKILKFRTMIPDAEARGSLTMSEDPRVTRFGRFLRRYKLDELPQLLNVVAGEMSLVGPRPEVPSFLEHCAERDRATLLSIRPGITDYASIEFRNEATLLHGQDVPQDYYLKNILPRKAELCRTYIRDQSLKEDIRILVRTLRAVATSNESS